MYLFYTPNLFFNITFLVHTLNSVLNVNPIGMFGGKEESETSLEFKEYR